MGRRYKNIHNIPYELITKKKWDSLGQTMTLKQALDLWWNSVRFEINGKNYICYKTCDYDYDLLHDLCEDLGMTEKQVLALEITLDDWYNFDADDYPIIYGTLNLGASK